MSKILSATISTLSFPTVECKAGNCLLMLVISTMSPSTIVMFPTPALAKNSAAKEPTPPKPTTKTLAFFKVSKPSFFTSSSERCNQSVIFQIYFFQAERSKSLSF